MRALTHDEILLVVFLALAGLMALGYDTEIERILEMVIGVFLGHTATEKVRDYREKKAET